MRSLFIALALFALPSAANAARYSLAFEGTAFGVLPVGALTLDLDVDGASYVAHSTVRSRGLLSLFEPTNLTARAEGVLGETVEWRSYDLDHHYSGKHRVTALRRNGDAVEARIEPNYRVWGSPPVSDAQRAASRDPLSSILAMSVDVARTRRCAGAYPTFDGRFHYALELSRPRRDRVDAGGFEGPALRCRLRYVPIAGFEQSDGGRRPRVAQGEIWFALVENAPLAPPVRFVLPLPVGAAHIHLTRFTRPSVSIDPDASP